MPISTANIIKTGFHPSEKVNAIFIELIVHILTLAPGFISVPQRNKAPEVRGFVWAVIAALRLLCWRWLILLGGFLAGGNVDLLFVALQHILLEPVRIVADVHRSLTIGRTDIAIL